MNNITTVVKTMLMVLHLITGMGLTVQSVDVHGYHQQVYTIKADTHYASVTQQVSKNQLYGFETLTEMAQSTNALVGINGMFYSDFGRPLGILIIDGELVVSQSIGTPLFIIRKNQYDNKDSDETGYAELINPELHTFLECNDKIYELKAFNEGGPDIPISLFTPWYGTNNRIRYLHTAVTVNKGRVTEVIERDSPSKIPFVEVNVNDNDYLLTYDQKKSDFSIEKGDEIRLYIESNFNYETVSQGFQTGGWLVKDGINVAKEVESYIGPTQSLQPRTAIGITQNGEIILKVVDGRNPGVSEGVTGEWLAELLLSDGCVNGAYLDGGASSSLVVAGELVNRPSLGEEKGISHGLFLNRLNKKVAK